jgi:glycosyltransferase involved in cell wall biosynthesis
MGSGAVKVLLSSYFYPPSVGGVESQSHLLARGLVARGHEVRVIAARLGGMRDTDTLDGVQLQRVSPGTGSRFRKMGTYLCNMAAAVLATRRWADVIQVQQALYPAAVMTGVAALLRRPLVVRNSGSGRFGAVSVMSTLPGGKASLRHIGRNATVVSLSEEMTAELERVPMRRIREIPNGVEIPEPISEAERRWARAHLRLGPSDAVALYFGRLDEEKGLALMFEAWSRHAPRGARLIVTGSGLLAGALREQARQMGEAGARIMFFEATRELRPQLAAADVFVLPSHSEGLSNSLLEAMAHGITPLATDVGGNRAVVSSLAVGVLAPRDPDVFGEKLALLLADRSAARAAGQRARAHVQTHYSVQAMLDAYEALYAELVADR